MKLSNTIIAKSKYKAASKFDFWKFIEIGDEIHISMNVTNPGHGRQRYATDIFFHNYKNNTKFSCSQTLAEKYLSHLEYTEQ